MQSSDGGPVYTASQQASIGGEYRAARCRGVEAGDLTPGAGTDDPVDKETLGILERSHRGRRSLSEDAVDRAVVVGEGTQHSLYVGDVSAQ